MFLGLHPQGGDAGASLVNILQGVLIRVGCLALVGRGRHRLHALPHGWRGAVEVTMAGVGLLKTLGRTHEAGHAVDGGGAG